eukprot:TRINITY_DN6106_c0_g1_i1.p1 TRINITY_DN6106_c0_g1~~TRINITY_DN6106_c0_g1_i1.p1  ORF type:complete len:201 (-),score=33.64 TRINITY_DN6106_c0_g1_i1:74-652(-)
MSIATAIYLLIVANLQTLYHLLTSSSVSGLAASGLLVSTLSSLSLPHSLSTFPAYDNNATSTALATFSIVPDHFSVHPLLPPFLPEALGPIMSSSARLVCGIGIGVVVGVLATIATGQTWALWSRSKKKKNRGRKGGKQEDKVPHHNTSDEDELRRRIKEEVEREVRAELQKLAWEILPPQRPASSFWDPHR